MWRTHFDALHLPSAPPACPTRAPPAATIRDTEMFVLPDMVLGGQDDSSGAQAHPPSCASRSGPEADA